MHTVARVAVVLTLFVGISLGSTVPVQATEKPLIQLAILLDTSGSMNGLIDQARSQLWKVVNELVSTKRNGLRPELQVALYEYGKSSIAASEGHIRQIVPLTTDLDKVSEELFALTTNGGDEYCGQVIQSATRGLQWSEDKQAFKLIYIAGNEPFTQGSVNYKDACKEAITKGIVVNTIHCGTAQQGIDGQWKDGALLADGAFMNIDQNRKVAHIAAPQDKEIAKLGEEMNGTYIAFGNEGRAGIARQEAQDGNAQKAATGSMMQRAVFKSSANYSNRRWDLVDAVKEGDVKLEAVKKEQLPKNMQTMSVAERKAFVTSNGKKRAEIQKKIQKLNGDRKKYVAEQRKKLSESGDDTLDAAMIKSIRKQAVRKNFSFE